VLSEAKSLVASRGWSSACRGEGGEEEEEALRGSASTQHESAWSAVMDCRPQVCRKIERDCSMPLDVFFTETRSGALGFPGEGR